MHLYYNVVAAGYDVALGDFLNLLELLHKLADVGAGLGAYTDEGHHMIADCRGVDVAVRAGNDLRGYKALHALVNGSSRHAIFACDFEIRRTRILTKGVEDCQV